MVLSDSMRSVLVGQTLSHGRYLLAGALILALWVQAAPVRAQGVILSAGGPIHRGMGGASTAAPLDAIGALYWNPATISGLERSELGFGIDLFLANHEITSSLGPFQGSSDSEPGVMPVPTFGWTYHLPDSTVTLGLGVGGVAGFKTNFLADPTNPVLAPPPFGLGRISAEGNFVQLTPVVSCLLSENLSFGFGPVITLGQIGVTPFAFAPPNAGGVYAPGRASRYHWGGGAQVGVYYAPNNAWRWGASVKSPAWMEEFRLFSEDANGAARVLHTKLDLPLIVSVGTAYVGLENWLFALDARYVDYKNANGFGDAAVFDGDASLQGLGWRGVFSVAMGAQRHVSEKLDVRLGYTYNQSPIDDADTFFNLATPLIYEHMFSAGISLAMCESVVFSLAYSYMLPNEREGPIVLPGIGPVPGSSVRSELDVHFLNFGVVMRH